MDPANLNVVSPNMTHSIIYVGKLVGSIGVIVGAVYAAGTWMVRVIRKVTQINDNVILLASNHFPHLQAAVDAHSDTLKEIKGDIKSVEVRVDGMSQRLEDTRASVHTLGDSFIRHIDSSARELVEAKAVSAKNELDIAAVQAAQEVMETAHTAAKNLLDTTKRTRKH